MSGQLGNVHRGNTVPAGGVTPNQVGGVAASGMMMPDTIQLQELSDLFMENSQQNYLQMTPVPLNSGQAANFTMQTVGLGEELELFVSGNIAIRNNGGTVQTVSLPPDFPYNIIRNVSIIFNGQASIVNTSAYDLLTLAIKRNLRSGFAITGETTRVTSRVASVSVVGGTLVSGPGLTGNHQITIAAATTATVTIGFYLPISFVLRKDLLLGLLPMANTSVHANVELTVSPFVGTTPDSPFMGDVNLSLVSSNISLTPAYKFWGLPARRELYQHFVNTSYVQTRQANKAIPNSGANAIAFEVPINHWLISALMTVRNSGRTLQTISTTIDNPHLVYNGTITVDRTNIRTKIARDFIHYGVDMPVGHLLYDYSHTGNLNSNSANMSRWLNMYQASNPVLYADVSNITLPGSYDVTLERLAPNHVQVI